VVDAPLRMKVREDGSRETEDGSREREVRWRTETLNCEP